MAARRRTDHQALIVGTYQSCRSASVWSHPKFIIDEARQCKFCVLLDTEEHKCMCDILLPKEMCSESRDLFKFWEINDNISETVIDRDIVAVEV